jgi:hypothetical protein
LWVRINPGALTAQEKATSSRNTVNWVFFELIEFGLLSLVFRTLSNRQRLNLPPNTGDRSSFRGKIAQPAEHFKVFPGGQLVAKSEG